MQFVAKNAHHPFSARCFFQRDIGGACVCGMELSMNFNVCFNAAEMFPGDNPLPFAGKQKKNQTSLCGLRQEAQ